MGHVGIEHQSTYVEHQQAHGLPTEPVTMMHLQVGGGQGLRAPLPSAHPLQPQEGYLLQLLVRGGRGQEREVEAVRSQAHHVGVAIEGVDMLAELLDRVLGENTESTANEAAERQT